MPGCVNVSIFDQVLIISPITFSCNSVNNTPGHRGYKGFCFNSVIPTECSVFSGWGLSSLSVCPAFKAGGYMLIPHGANKYSLVLLILFDIHLNTEKQCTDSNPCCQLTMKVLSQVKASSIELQHNKKVVYGIL